MAGGRSRRFGRDKAREPVFGVPSLQRVVSAAEAALPGDRVVVHDLPTEGPLGAIVDSFARWPGRDLVILACDLPFIDPPTIARLAAPCESEARVVLIDGRSQPLAARYRRSAAEVLGRAFASGDRSIVKLLDQGQLTIEWLRDVSPSVLADFDTQEDLDRLVSAGRR